MNKRFLVCCLSLGLLSCNPQEAKQSVNTENSVSKKPDHATARTLIDLDDRLSRADSLVFVFYKDPHGNDSLRYTRYYDQQGVTDTAELRFFKENLRDTTERLERIKPCRSEGKIWCFVDGDIFQTVYFSASAEPCNFLYLIKDGWFYYTGMPPLFAKKLSQLKRSTRKA